MRFFHVVVGGTFDHLHTGHAALLTRAFSEGTRVTIGLTTDRYVQQYKQGREGTHEENVSGGSCCCGSQPRIASYKKRKEYLEAWLNKQGVMARTTIVPLNDAYGPAARTVAFDAIVVSKETEPIAKKINALRKKQGITPLVLIVVHMVPAEDMEAISSTRIRNGEIDHEGNLILPVTLRKTLTKPIGTLIPDGVPIPAFSKNTCSISVGDTTTMKLVSQGILPTLAIIDFQARRQEFDWETTWWQILTHKRSIFYFTSGPGFIHTTVMEAIRRWAKRIRPALFVIRGEEDLLVLPAILYAPQHALVFYGQPEQGIMQVAVTRHMKRKAHMLLSQFI